MSRRYYVNRGQNPCPDGIFCWSPECIIDSVNFWIDASLEDTVTLDVDGRVEQINDISGNNRHATQPTPSDRPFYSLSELNGRNVIRFDGVESTQLELPPFGVSGNQPRTIVQVQFIDASTTFNQAIWAQNQFTAGGGVADWLFHYSTANTGHIWYSYGSGNTSTPGPGGSLNTWRLVTFNFDGVNWQYGIRGLPAIRTGTATLNTLDQDNVIGRRDGQNFYKPFNGFMAEMIYFNKSLNSDEFDRLNNYLGKKWGLEGEIRFNNQYKPQCLCQGFPYDITCPLDYMLFEDGEQMLFEDGTDMLFDT